MLLQILTGQGKSITIACFTAILTMRGFIVDIITTSPVLAKRDVQEQKIFFNLLGLSFSHNLNEQEDEKKYQPKQCYAGNNIVIGTPYSYQVDLLYDEYQQKGTRNNRPYNVAIIDEVDSMLIDEKQSQTLLSSAFAGFSQLILPMRILWQTIIKHNIMREGDSFFLYQNGKKQGQIIKGQMNQVMNIIIKDIRQKFNNQFVPKWRLQFIQFSIQDWIMSAIYAAHLYKQNKQYIVQNGKIIPVNNLNNGILQRNTHLSNGLHQFLQMKHGLNVTIQTMTSNFMSNIGHFTRYQRIYGLTGTLGSSQSKRFLQFTYNAQMLDIPPYMERKLKIQDGFLMYCQQDWLLKIVQRTKQIISENRSVLLICSSIHHTQVINFALTECKINYKKIHLITDDKEQSNQNVDCKQNIIATNIAGRGTNFITSKDLTKNGGLHVIITFMPKNLRIQMQARGRAGRNGAPGSSQLIVDYNYYCSQIGIPNYKKQLFKSLEMQNNIKSFIEDSRDAIQAKLMKSDKAKVVDLKTKDQMFKCFCDAVKQIPDFRKNKAKKDAIQQQWAMFLKKAEKMQLNNQQKIIQAKKLIDQILKDSQKFYNPSHRLWRGIVAYSDQKKQQAKQHFIQMQNSQSTKINQIAGGMLQATVRINTDDKKKKSEYPYAINLLNQSHQKIEKKKDYVKSTNVLTLTTDNSKNLQLLTNQSQFQLGKSKQKFKQLINQNNARPLSYSVHLMQNQVSQILKEKSNIELQLKKEVKVIDIQKNNIRNQQVDYKQKRQAQKKLNIPEINILNFIHDFIQIQVQKIANVKQDQYVQMQFKQFTKVINLKQFANPQILKQVLDKFSVDFPIIPEANVKKIEKQSSSWWKRALVFCIGVLQICIGALIIYATEGALTNFGTSMILSGFNDCMTALFSPQKCENLQAFFTKKSIQYVINLATLGNQEISQLAKLGKNGFKILQNTSFKQIAAKAGLGIKQGLSKGLSNGLQSLINLDGLSVGRLFFGITSIVQNNSSKKIIPDDIFKVMKNPSFKSSVKNAVAQQQSLQFVGQQIKKTFIQNYEKQIRIIIQKEHPKFIQDIKKLNINPKLIYALIEIQFQRTLNQNFFENQKIKRQQKYKEILHFVAKNLQDQQLAKLFIKQFNIDKLISKSIENIGKNQHTFNIIQNSKIGLYNKFIQNIKQIINRQQDQLRKQHDNIKKQENSIENSPLTQSQRNQRIDKYNKRVELYKVNQNNYNNFIKQLQKLPKQQKFIDQLMNKKIIVDGKISQNQINKSSYHRFIKQSLLKYENFSPSLNQFKQILFKKAYNSFAGISVKAVDQIIDNSSNSISKLKNIQKMLYAGLKK